LLRDHLAVLADDPADRVLAGALRAEREIARGRRGVAREVAAIAIERVPRHVEAQGLLLEREQLLVTPDLDLWVGLTLPDRRSSIRTRCRARRCEQTEQRRLPAAPVALLGRAALERCIERREQLRAVVAARQSIKRAAL